MRNVVLFLASLCLVSACSTGTDEEPSAEPTPTSTSTTGTTSASLSIPTPTSSVSVRPADSPWSTEEAVDAYRAAMRPVNTRLTKLSEMPPDARLSKTRAALRSYSRASTDAVETILAGQWGDDLRGSVNTLIAALLGQQQYFDALANGRDVAAIQAQSDKTGQTLLVTRACAAALEKDLGIGDGLIDLAPRGAS